MNVRCIYIFTVCCSVTFSDDLLNSIECLSNRVGKRLMTFLAVQQLTVKLALVLETLQTLLVEIDRMLETLLER